MIIKRFIVFEGIDGAGTTTQLKRLGNFFKKEELITTAEPTDRETGLFLRKMLKGELKFSPRTAAYLFAADRAEHLYGKGGIIENTEKGMFVVSDRYIFSSLAYQAVSCPGGLPSIINSPFPLPELLFYFKINPEVSIRRVEKRGGVSEIYEKIDYQKKTAARFDSVIKEFDGTEKGKGMKIVTLDAERTVEELTEKIVEELKKIKN